MKLAVVGSRNFEDYDMLVRELDKMGKVDLIISGAAKGADTLAEKYAAERGIPVKIFPADWKKHGRRAGFIRNHDIIDSCEEVIAFWDGNSAGTAHSIALAARAGKKVTIRSFENGNQAD